MNKQICPDCGQEAEIGIRTGICKKCSARKANAKYQNKPYIKLIDSENKIVRRKTETKIVKEMEEENLETKLYSKEIEEAVDKDIDINLKARKVNLPKNMSFGIVFEIVYNVIHGIDNISEYLKAEDVFNKLENDYRHGYENAKTMEEFNYWSKLYRCLLDKRREIKNVVSEYEAGGYIFKELSNNKEFVDSFDKAYGTYKQVHEMNEKGQYRQRSESQIVKNSDFCIGKKNETTYLGQFKYLVLFKPVQQNIEPFRTIVYAKDEKDAIEQADKNKEKTNWKFPVKRPNGIEIIKLTSDYYDSEEKEYL